MVFFERLTGEGARITTGKHHELFTFKPRAPEDGSEPPPSELDGLSRAQVRQAMERLIASGRILRDASGALTLPK